VPYTKRTRKRSLSPPINSSVELLGSEPNLLYLQDPVTIVGDVHGQFYDMREIFRLGGNPEATKYLFLGDYVDRGNYGVEIILTLYALKIAYPNLIFMLRGNHECRQMTSYHNFREECLQKYDQEIYDMLMDSFDQLPLAAIINGQFLALHGGISPELENAMDLNRADRFREPPQLGILCDVLWSDPVDNDSGLQAGMWMPNPSRGCSYYFG
jgi:serine/threonine-protein phosphatase 2B catalytic subunit